MDFEKKHPCPKKEKQKQYLQPFFSSKGKEEKDKNNYRKNKGRNFSICNKKQILQDTAKYICKNCYTSRPSHLHHDSFLCIIFHIIILSFFFLQQ